MQHPREPINEPFLAFALDFRDWKFGNNGMTWAVVLHLGSIAALVYLWLAGDWHWLAPVFLFFVLAATWVATAIQWRTKQMRAWRAWAQLLVSPRGSHSPTEPDSYPGPYTIGSPGISDPDRLLGVQGPGLDTPLWFWNHTPASHYAREVCRRMNMAYHLGRKSNPQ